MALVTQVKQQVKRPDRYSVYLDGVYSFSLSEVDLIGFGLHSGQQLTDTDVAQYRDASAYRKWYDKILNLLSYRMRSEWEVTNYLKRKQCPEGFRHQILTKLKDLDYVNDEVFARSWVAHRRSMKPTSRRKLTQELQQKRINTQIIVTVLSDDREVVDEQEVLRALIAKKRARYPDRQKFMQYLARQGYSYHDIRQVLEQFSDT